MPELMTIKGDPCMALLSVVKGQLNFDRFELVTLTSQRVAEESGVSPTEIIWIISTGGNQIVTQEQFKEVPLNQSTIIYHEIRDRIAPPLFQFPTNPTKPTPGKRHAVGRLLLLLTETKPIKMWAPARTQPVSSDNNKLSLHHPPQPIISSNLLGHSSLQHNVGGCLRSNLYEHCAICRINIGINPTRQLNDLQ